MTGGMQTWQLRNNKARVSIQMWLCSGMAVGKRIDRAMLRHCHRKCTKTHLCSGLAEQEHGCSQLWQCGGHIRGCGLWRGIYTSAFKMVFYCHTVVSPHYQTGAVTFLDIYIVPSDNKPGYYYYAQNNLNTFVYIISMAFLCPQSPQGWGKWKILSLQ